MKTNSVVVLAAALALCGPAEVSAKLRKKDKSTKNDFVDDKEAFQEALMDTANTGGELFEEEPSLEMVEVIIGMNIEDDESTFSVMSTTLNPLSDAVTLESLIPQIKSGVARIPLEMVEMLRNNPRVKYVEPNGAFYENSEFIPTSIAESFGRTDPKAITPAPGVTSDCTDPNAFRIAVLDGGIDVGHYDFEWCGVYDGNGQSDPKRVTRCMGKSFLRSSDAAAGQDWYNAKRDHGMHVAGTMVASGLNHAGVMGMISDESVCLVVSRVFGDLGGATVAGVAEAIIWAADMGARVINMSLGTSTAYASVTDAVDYAYARGAILVASAGNGADRSPPLLVNYPADYPNVLSVGAVDLKYNIASFSNYNRNVDLTAVGVDVLSTIIRPANGADVEIVSPVGTFVGTLMLYSKFTSGTGITGTIVDCGNGNGACSGARGKVCVFERGGSASFFQKVRNCQGNGGVAAIIYDPDQTAKYGGTMDAVNNSPNFVEIPAVGVGSDAGGQLLGIIGREVTIASPLTQGYGRLTGTSMAAPHVAGAAGLIWRACPQCERDQVVNCVLATAVDKGVRGRDDYFGNGVLDAGAAFECLSASSCCSSSDQQPFARPSHSPSRAPTPIPTRAPTHTPTSSPTAKAALKLSQCQNACHEKHQFCTFMAGEHCSTRQTSCVTSCESAATQGLLSRNKITICKSEWCSKRYDECVEEKISVCDGEVAQCNNFCRTSS